ncbi:MAG: bifunctional diaminohydroxyphosphoribosylaminopyrimidine deaminase/5-amino-6-(5-phosphoribosylamino)uracil reductase RibD [Candidatus Nanopelagicaceae bacterium]|nr:bifunctional diaminohydroxyphosphoribosylaminopyrimidine deaminase/5-amino-6-(5-phosphoribosylamino)uracil reductase RibD [Candidatus Nanopelagicaceae bacterium]
MDDRLYMTRAIDLSLLGLGKTSPNPLVGAVLLSSSGEVIGEGFHAGEEHAEVRALMDCSVRQHDPKGATMYVTLEPCNHFGTTPPCTQALKRAGVSRVVFAVKDPNPVAQGGATDLLEAGIEVVAGLMEGEVRESNRSWLHKIESGRPFLIWKIASTLDGYSAALDGTSKWITSEESRMSVQGLRAESDAILVGTGTVLADNPSLIPRGDDRRPIRIVVGTRSIPGDSHLKDAQATTIFLKTRDLHVVIDALVELGVNQVLIESGSELGTSLLKKNLIDEIHWYQAPTILGAGMKTIGNLDVKTISQRMDFEVIKVERSGPDILTILRPKTREKAEVDS